MAMKRSPGPMCWLLSQAPGNTCAGSAGFVLCRWACSPQPCSISLRVNMHSILRSSLWHIAFSLGKLYHMLTCDLAGYIATFLITLHIYSCSNHEVTATGTRYVVGYLGQLRHLRQGLNATCRVRRNCWDSCDTWDRVSMQIASEEKSVGTLVTLETGFR